MTEPYTLLHYVQSRIDFVQKKERNYREEKTTEVLGVFTNCVLSFGKEMWCTNETKDNKTQYTGDY